MSGIPDGWNPTVRKRSVDANIVETVFEGKDPVSGLGITVECLEYRDFPVVEWTAWFSNRQTVPTPVLADILAVDAVFGGESPVLYHCNGDFYSEEGYTPSETPMRNGDSLSFAPKGGRACDGAFPYFRVMFKDCGLCIAVGWPGQWAASFEGVAGGVRVRAGQEKTNLRLMPGETIRTPRMTVLGWTGPVSRGVNLWRRWYLAHVLPRPDGRPIRPMLAAFGTDEGEEFTAATEENQIKYMDRFKALDIHPDVWWIDAGWYPCYDKDRKRHWGITGTWKPDPERFPRGLRPVSDHAARLGSDLLVWFEPERVVPGTELDAKQPRWLLDAKNNPNRLLNLGNQECREWLTDHVSALISENGIRIYRQDHNFEPLAHWRGNEPEDRQGINENLHVQGYLRFWDDLLSRHPGLWIDSCASGGRRNDLETMRRSVPLHYSDFGYGNHPVKLAFQRTLFEWIPYFKDCTLAWDVGAASRFDNQADAYSCHCGMAPMLFLTLDIRRADYDYAIVRRMAAIWRRAAPLFLHGDYYPLTPFHRAPDKWVVRQFFVPEASRGLIQGIRLPACPEETMIVHPEDISPDASYFFDNPETGETVRVAGSALARNGFTMRLPRRGASIWFYRMTGPGE